MAKYTILLKTVLENVAQQKTPINEVIEKSRGYIFPTNTFDKLFFDLPFTDDFKKYFEYAFLNKYYFDELGCESVAMFIQRVNSKLYEITPKYYIMFDILSKIDYDKILSDYGDYNVISTAIENKIGDTTTQKTENGKTTEQTGSKTANSALPENMLNKGVVGDFINVGYADNSSISRSDNEKNNSFSSNEKSNDNETRNTVNNQTTTGRTKNQIETLKELNASFNIIFNNFLDEFQDLFMQIW